LVPTSTDYVRPEDDQTQTKGNQTMTLATHTTPDTRKRDHDAENQARAQYASIAELVAALEAADESGDDTAQDAAREAIEADALSVEVRSDWHVPGAREPGASAPTEYRILLCAGGPAVQLIGDLNEHCEPVTARLQYQDWFVPWTDYCGEEYREEVALTYARSFYFGE
jgi:hypothetical protein